MKPAVQLLHTVAPDTLNLPTAQMLPPGVGVVSPAAHA
jgi:hypothetical protein